VSEDEVEKVKCQSNGTSGSSSVTEGIERVRKSAGEKAVELSGEKERKLTSARSVRKLDQICRS